MVVLRFLVVEEEVKIKAQKKNCDPGYETFDLNFLQLQSTGLQEGAQGGAGPQHFAHTFTLGAPFVLEVHRAFEVAFITTTVTTSSGVGESHGEEDNVEEEDHRHHIECHLNVHQIERLRAVAEDEAVHRGGAPAAGGVPVAGK